MTGMREASREIIYQLDRDGRILSVNEAWDDFAQENGGEAVLADRVLGRPLGQYISDPVTRALYEHLVDRARRSGQDVRFRLRCDSPGRRRLLEVRIAPAPDDGVEFRTRVVDSSERDVPVLLDPAAPRGGDFIGMCSWCQRLEVDGRWLEVEDVVRELRLFERPEVPQVSHGICPDCHSRMSDYHSLH